MEFVLGFLFGVVFEKDNLLSFLGFLENIKDEFYLFEDFSGK